MQIPAGVNSDKQPVLLCGVSQGELHLACTGGVISGAKDTIQKT